MVLEIHAETPPRMPQLNSQRFSEVSALPPPPPARPPPTPRPSAAAKAQAQDSVQWPAGAPAGTQQDTAGTRLGGPRAPSHWCIMPLPAEGSGAAASSSTTTFPGCVGLGPQGSET